MSWVRLTNGTMNTQLSLNMIVASGNNGAEVPIAGARVLIARRADRQTSSDDARMSA